MPERLVGDETYDSDPLDKQVTADFGVDLISPHEANLIKAKTQDRRNLRRYKRR